MLRCENPRFALSEVTVRPIFTWTYTVLLTLAFVGAGAAKLTAQPVMVEQFSRFGYPLWFMYLTGAIEFGAALLVLVPRFAHIAAAALACVMAGAIYAHLTHGEAGMVLPPILLLILALAVGTLRGWGGGARIRRSAAGFPARLR
jgi:uncharacterized membrane protein YphA (DoxX/SURF4 family)